MTDISEKTKEFYLDKHHDLIDNIIKNKNILTDAKLDLINHIIICSSGNLFNGIASIDPDGIESLANDLCLDIRRLAKDVKFKQEAKLCKNKN